VVVVVGGLNWNESFGVFWGGGGWVGVSGGNCFGTEWDMVGGCSFETVRFWVEGLLLGGVMVGQMIKPLKKDMKNFQAEPRSSLREPIYQDFKSDRLGEEGGVLSLNEQPLFTSKKREQKLETYKRSTSTRREKTRLDLWPRDEGRKKNSGEKVFKVRSDSGPGSAS